MVRKVLQPGQRILKEIFGALLPPNRLRAQEKIRCLSEYIAKDLRMFYVVENDGFWKLIKTLDHHGIVAVIDDTQNMYVAVREAGLSSHIKGIAYTLNLTP